MKAILIVREKRVVGETITEAVAWKLTKPVLGCKHHFKYRFYFGLLDGTCILRYDNERGKGDHKHIDGKEEPYDFISLPQTFKDFNNDKAAWLASQGGNR